MPIFCLNPLGFSLVGPVLGCLRGWVLGCSQSVSHWFKAHVGEVCPETHRVLPTVEHCCRQAIGILRFSASVDETPVEFKNCVGNRAPKPLFFKHCWHVSDFSITRAARPTRVHTTTSTNGERWTCHRGGGGRKQPPSEKCPHSRRHTTTMKQSLFGNRTDKREPNCGAAKPGEPGWTTDDVRRRASGSGSKREHRPPNTKCK